MKAFDVSISMKLVAILILKCLSGCNLPETQYDAKQVAMWESPANVKADSVKADTLKKDSVAQLVAKPSPVVWDTSVINTREVTPSALVAFAQSQLGVPYRYGSTDPKRGFDCSGFITYVFSHFNIHVPRSSVEFTHVGKKVTITEAKPGDLILFTGTDSTIRRVGHMGIIHAVDSSGIQFIHSSSGKVYGVTITPLNKYYQGRFMSVRRVFPANDGLSPSTIAAQGTRDKVQGTGQEQGTRDKVQGTGKEQGTRNKVQGTSKEQGTVKAQVTSKKQITSKKQVTSKKKATTATKKKATTTSKKATTTSKKKATTTSKKATTTSKKKATTTSKKKATTTSKKATTTTKKKATTTSKKQGSSHS